MSSYDNVVNSGKRVRVQNTGFSLLKDYPPQGMSGIFLSSANIFFKINSFEKIFQEYHLSTCQTDWIQIRPDILSSLIWVQSVC